MNKQFIELPVLMFDWEGNDLFFTDIPFDTFDENDFDYDDDDDERYTPAIITKNNCVNVNHITHSSPYGEQSRVCFMNNDEIIVDLPHKILSDILLNVKPKSK